jgi:hypothetical protein
MSIGGLVALLVIVVAFLGLIGVVPMSAAVVFGLILGLAIAVVLSGFAIPWPAGGGRI